MNMKKLFKPGLVVMIYFAMFSVSQATPMYYTFSGEIYSAYADSGWNGPGSVPSEYRDQMIGQAISFTLLLDVDIWLDNSANSAALIGYSDNLIADTGHLDETLSVSTQQLASGPSGAVYFDSTYNTLKFGYEQLVGSGLYTDFNWDIGTELAGWSFAKNFYLGFEYLMTLQQIDDSYAVPEPASFMLLGLGLVGLGFSRYTRDRPLFNKTKASMFLC